MALRLGLLFLFAVLAATSFAAQSTDQDFYSGLGGAQTDGHGLVSDALELDEELMMESEAARRQLQGRRGYGGGHISYGALSRNKVPCNQRGASYYNCHGHQKANPYNRSCTRATRCARNNH